MEKNYFASIEFNATNISPYGAKRLQYIFFGSDGKDFER